MLKKIKERIPEKFKKSDTWTYILKRFIYIAGFAGLCMIDQMIGSATGYIQYGYKNYTGIIIGIFILTAYRIKDFIRIPYLIWIVSFFVFRFFSLDWLTEVFYNDIEVVTILWGILLYGIILIRMFYLYAVEKKKLKMNWELFSVCLIMLLGMAIIRSDYSWPKDLAGAVILFYLTDFKEKDLNNLFSGMAEGIIIGFLVIQVQAWMYRPYDMVRYEGMYSHSNMNALMYLCAYSAVLCKWYLMKLKRNNIFFRIPIILLAGLIMGTMFFTGGRAAFITAIVLTLIFLIFQMLSNKKRRGIEFLFDGVVLSVSIALCVLPAYWLIRYVPVYVNQPMYFETDYARGLKGKILKDEPIDSEKYVELGEAADEMFQRYLWFLDEETYANVVRWIRDFPESMQLSLKVDAALISEGIDEEVKANVWDGEDNAIKQFINPRTGKITETHYNYRVSNLISILNKRSVCVTSEGGFSGNVGWRFLDSKENIVFYGRYVKGETKQILNIPDDAKYFQFTWNADINTNVKIDFTDVEVEDANVKVVEPGADSEHPLILSDEQEGIYDVRVDIYKYFWDKLKLIGEKDNSQGVWIVSWYKATHCHNVFLQVAYDFGIIIGIMFILVVLMFYVRVLIGLIRKRSGSWYYRLLVATMFTTLFVVFGMFEMCWVYGQLPFTMFFIVQYIVYHKEMERPQLVVNEDTAIESEQTSVNEQLTELLELEIEEL